MILSIVILVICLIFKLLNIKITFISCSLLLVSFFPIKNLIEKIFDIQFAAAQDVMGYYIEEKPKFLNYLTSITPLDEKISFSEFKT